MGVDLSDKENDVEIEEFKCQMELTDDNPYNTRSRIKKTKVNDVFSQGNEHQHDELSEIYPRQYAGNV